MPDLLRQILITRAAILYTYMIYQILNLYPAAVK
jgi:hypothetical protein